MADTEAGSSSTDTVEAIVEKPIDKSEDFSEPELKKRKLSNEPDSKPDKLELRLGGILCCAVCLDLPRAAIYQVSFNLQLFTTVINDMHNLIFWNWTLNSNYYISTLFCLHCHGL